jgi:inorganic pyrophosphatase
MEQQTSFEINNSTVDVQIEIPLGQKVKYEIDHNTNTLRC